MIYENKDLTRRLQSFKKDTKIHRLLRIMLLLLNLNNVLFIIYVYGLGRLSLYFTNWTLLMTCIYLGVATVVSDKSSYTALAIHHILFEISLVMNVVVVCIYWSILHEESLLEAKGNILKIANCYWAHLGPAFSVWFNFSISNHILKSNHVVAFPLIAALYGYVNYLETKKAGKPLYWFLTWDDSSSLWIYTSLIVIFSLLYLGLA